MTSDKKKRCHKCGEGGSEDNPIYLRKNGRTLGICRKCNTKKLREYRLADVPRWRLNARRSYRKLYETIMHHYGNGDLKCACCGETEIGFLTLDHINNNGAEHRRIVMNGKSTTGPRFYLWLKRNNYPPGFQVLCYNCNCSKGKYGKCAHRLTHEERRALCLGTYRQLDLGMRAASHTAPVGGMSICD